MSADIDSKNCDSDDKNQGPIDQDSVINAKVIETDFSYKKYDQVFWSLAIFFIVLHILALWGFAIMITGGISFKAVIWAFVLYCISILSTTVGSHRYYTHKCFKATPLLRSIFIFGQTVAGQYSMYQWVRDHRLHHRYSDTDADPYNSSRGFFFSHIGWLMTKKHPLLYEVGKRIDMSDLEADWMVRFQRKYFLLLYIPISILIPMWVSVHYFGDTWLNAFLFVFMFRYMVSLHATWLVNSAAHLYGTRPYDKNLHPVESWFVSLLTMGEGWHNYHHAFPWDYKTAELPMPLNFSATLIRFLEKIGLAYDLKTASPDMVKNRVLRTGDGTHFEFGNDLAKSEVTAIGPVHPLNPSYSVKYEPTKTTLGQEGLPLYDENDVLHTFNSSPENNANVKIRNIAS